MNSSKRLSERVYGLASFQTQYRELVRVSVASQIKNLQPFQNSDCSLDLWNLVACASVLAQSEKSEPLDAALRIAQYCMQLSERQYSQAAAALFEVLTNKPAIGLAIKRNHIRPGYRDFFPLPLRMDSIRRDIEYSIESRDGRILAVNRFQKAVYRSIVDEGKRFVSISAPTSTGKSFILCQILMTLVARAKRKTNIVYIVPTRALISQVETDVKQELARQEIPDVSVHTVPMVELHDMEISSNVFVFTQERLHWFRMEHPSTTIDYLFVDEAHKIQDGSRGILLQQEIEELLTDNADMSVCFSSPYIENPECLLNGHQGESDSRAIKLDFVTVNQNLLFVNPDPHNSKMWNVSLCHDQGVTPVGTFSFDYRLATERKKVLFLAEAFAEAQGGVVIYANGAAEAEKHAMTLYALRRECKYRPTPEVLELIKLVKKVLHRNYSLATVLKRGIGFHYGNMPQLIRAEIERLFKNGHLGFLVCTSTLLEGVNLPARTLIIRKPTRGKNRPMNRSDFWNLAGRAGRWGMEFQGNIVCIEPNSWENTPDISQKRISISRATELSTEDKYTLLEYIDEGTPRPIAVKRPDLEGAVSYFYTAFLTKRLMGAVRGDRQFEVDLRRRFEDYQTTSPISPECIRCNPGVSPYAMAQLYRYFTSYEKPIENLIPVLPETENAVASSYIPLIVRISRYLSGDTEALAPYRAILVTDWMRGMPLSLLISRSERYWRSKRKRKSIDTVVRDVMKDVEEFARFKFAKYSACYVDVLRPALRSLGHEEVLQKIPSLNMWLEFGVSQKTQISLISLGLSRNTAIALSEMIRDDSFSKKDCIEWFASTNLRELALSPIIHAEIGLKLLNRKLRV